MAVFIIGYACIALEHGTKINKAPVALLMCAFTWTLYTIGVNSGMFNLVYDCAKPEERADSLAVCQSISGLSGFLITLVFSTVVTAMQQGGNQLFGMTVYAQQLLSVVSLLATLGAVAYVHFRVKKKIGRVQSR